ncbi:MAG: amidase, partial [Anaerolineales bacterium]|nr:amidase [Anaerolineales bacterium]
MEAYSISTIQQKIDSGELTAEYLTRQYLERIEKLDKKGPAVNSVIETNPAAIEIAAALDQERKERGPRSSLHGIPILIKDSIDTADRMRTTAGSLALENSIARQDAFIVKKLRQAGAVILGKTNLSEWLNFRSTRPTHGWSSRGGQTRNPYALDRNPSGSSSGSAVAVATNLCAAAIGTETDGSIITPSHANSIVGIKPTVGLVSRAGFIPLSLSQDTAGPMARSVKDAAILLGALTGVDPLDPVTGSSTGKSFTDYVQFLDPNGLQGARIGVARDYFGFNSRVDRIMDDCIDMMASMGAAIVDPATLNIDKNELLESELEVIATEFKDGINRYLENLAPDVPVHSLAELIDFNEQNRALVMPYFGQERLYMAMEKGPLSNPAYKRARANCLRIARTDGIDRTMRIHHLDAIVVPSGGPAWLTDWVKGD